MKDLLTCTERYIEPLGLYLVYHMLKIVTRQVKLKDDTCERLLKLGRMGETFDYVVKKCIEAYEEKLAREKSRK
jgi:hypothetical protein